MTPEQIPSANLYSIGCNADTPPHIARMIEEELFKRMAKLPSTKVAPPERPKSVRPDSTKARLNAMGPDWISTSDVAKQWGVSLSYTRLALHKLKEEGAVFKEVILENGTQKSYWSRGQQKMGGAQHHRGRQAYIDAIAKGLRTTKEIAADVGVTRDSALRILNRMAKDGEVTYIWDARTKVYSLPQNTLTAG